MKDVSTERINEISKGIRKACFDNGQNPNLFEICTAFSSVLAATIMANKLAYDGKAEAELIKLATETITAVSNDLCNMRRDEKECQTFGSDATETK